jgi:hypothetical protein
MNAILTGANQPSKGMWAGSLLPLLNLDEQVFTTAASGDSDLSFV